MTFTYCVQIQKTKKMIHTSSFYNLDNWFVSINYIKNKVEGGTRQ